MASPAYGLSLKWSTVTEVYVAGCASVPFGRHPDRSLLSLAYEAAHGALADAGVGPAMIGAGYFANALAAKLFGDTTVGQSVFGAMGVGGIPVVNIENACTSGSTAIVLAAQAIRAGDCETALVVGAEKMCVPQLGLLNSGESDLDTLLGRVAPASFALRAVAHSERFGTTTEQMASIAVKNRAHAAYNPIAQYRDPITLAEVIASPMIANPLTRLQCCPIADGAAAVLLVSANIARRLGAVVVINAALLSSGYYRNAQDLAVWQTDVEGARHAYERAGIGPDDLDLIECHDAFTISEIMHYEALGLCAPGDGGAFGQSAAPKLGGRIPVNPSGGLLSRGHPPGATGVEQLAELTRHLLGRAGARQVEAATCGLAHCMGGDQGEDTKSMTVIVASR